MLTSRQAWVSENRPDATYRPSLESRRWRILARMPRRADILERFGKRVRKFRSEAGYSQETFAAKCGLDRTYQGGIERGERNVALRNIERIARGLKNSVAELMDGV